MKKICILLLALSTMMLSGCFKEFDNTFTDIQVEFEDAVRTARAAGVVFPVFNLTRASGVRNHQVNLIGPHFSADQEMTFVVDTEVSIDPLLNANTIRAVEGVHFNIRGGRVTIPANSSVGTVSFEILNTFPAQTGRTAILVLRLDGNAQIKPAENFRRIGFRINLN